MRRLAALSLRIAAFAGVALGFAGSLAAQCLSPDDLLPALRADDAIFVARDVDLPETRYLAARALPSEEPEDIFGGALEGRAAPVADRHMCDQVSLRPIGAAAAWHRPQFAVALASNVDYRLAYPEIHDSFMANGLMIPLAAGRYRVVRFANRPPRPESPVYEAAARASARCDGHVARGDRTLLFPLC